MRTERSASRAANALVASGCAASSKSSGRHAGRYSKPRMARSGRRNSDARRGRAAGRRQGPGVAGAEAVGEPRGLAADAVRRVRERRERAQFLRSPGGEAEDLRRRVPVEEPVVPEGPEEGGNRGVREQRAGGAARRADEGLGVARTEAVAESAQGGSQVGGRRGEEAVEELAAIEEVAEPHEVSHGAVRRVAEVPWSSAARARISARSASDAGRSAPPRPPWRTGPRGRAARTGPRRPRGGRRRV